MPPETTPAAGRRRRPATMLAAAVEAAPAAGQPLPTKPVALAKGSQVLVDQRALIDAVEYLELADPTNAGWWIPAAAVAL